MEKRVKEDNPVELITRKQAIKKAGFTALTATSLLFLQTSAYAAGSQETPGSAASPGSGRPSRGE